MFSKIKQIVNNSNIQKAQIADAIGITSRQLQRYINGESEPTASKVKAICEYFQVSADWLLDINLEHKD